MKNILYTSVLGGIAFGTLSAEGVEQHSRKNVVMIILDDLNDSVTGMGGHPQAKTPNIDRLMKRGVRFSNAASNCPICGPSRASLWSGLYPHTTGYFGYNQQKNHWRKNPVLKDTVTVFEHLVNNGYDIFATGKIHHNGHEDMSIFKNSNGSKGFGTLGNFGPLPWDGKPETERMGVMSPWFPKYVRKAKGAGFGPIQDLKKYGDNYSWTEFYAKKEWKYVDDNNHDPMPDEVNAAEAVRFINKKHDKPFMLTVGFSRPHGPWYAPKKYFDEFPLETIQETKRKINDTDDCAPSLVKDRDIDRGVGWYKYKLYMNTAEAPTMLKQWTQAYLACVLFADEQVGKVLDALEKSGQADNTVVILTSDHGYHMGEKEYLFKFSPWEESVRLPMVIAGPGFAQNKECAKPVSLIDIYPTIIDIADLDSEPNKSGNKKSLDGDSLVPLLRSPEDGIWSGNDFTISVVASKYPVKVNTPAPRKEQHYSLRTEQFRYILCRNGDEELYDHAKDPHEWVNLAGKSEFRLLKESLKLKLIGKVGL